jgi:hypothetical protein
MQLAPEEPWYDVLYFGPSDQSMPCLQEELDLDIQTGPRLVKARLSKCHRNLSLSLEEATGTYQTAMETFVAGMSIFLTACRLTNHT